ncbi:hypothetical protein ACIBKY_39190 [Nonomuraea sp. NPDC050394]|uniref:deazapurine DNA modification protein DpdA family protein n=1 Tax=Nonomuraea sp. NPDC050394 TaxID=3364363 RepID=UPI0037B9A234
MMHLAPPTTWSQTDIPTFVIGIPEPSWLARISYPVMISYGRLSRRPLSRQLAARCPTYVDSRGFTELQHHGRWTITPHEYVEWLRRHRTQINLKWAAQQDWMCEPAIIHGGRLGRQTFVGTGLSVREHIFRTVENYLTLTELAPDLDIFPVVPPAAPATARPAPATTRGPTLHPPASRPGATPGTTTSPRSKHPTGPAPDLKEETAMPTLNDLTNHESTSLDAREVCAASTDRITACQPA